jgi:hypothetical protein
VSSLYVEMNRDSEFASHEASILRRAWAEQELAPEQEIGVAGRCYCVLGFDPVSVRPRRLYVEDLNTGRRYAVEIPG